MFHKLISNLPFNPSMVGQLSFYSKRLKQEESIRRIGLFFIVLSMLVQMFAALVPAEPSLAASNNDVISGGVKSIGELKSKYNAKSDVRSLYNRFGLNSDDLTANKAKNVSFKFKSQGDKGTRTVGRINFASTKDHNLGSFAGSTFYSRNAAEWQGSTAAYYFGKQKGTDGKTYEVWVLKDCGNIAYRPVETEKPAPKPKPTPTKPTPTKPTPTKPTPVTTPKPITPQVSCTSLRADKTSGKKSVSVRFTANYYANQPNIVNGITFDFGDGNKITHNGTVIDHTFSNDGLTTKKYTTKVTINSTVGDKSSTACQVTISVLPEVCELNPNLKPDDPRCAVCQYNPNLAPDDPRCKPPSDPVCENNPALKPNDPNCKCPDNPEITADDPNCLAPGRQKKAQNITQNLSPEKTSQVAARPGDVIEYSLITTNSNVVARGDYVVDDYIGDILDYADLDQAFLSSQGGEFNADRKIIVWNNQKIPAQGELIKKFRVVMKNPIPATNVPNATAADFNCKLENSYGNDVVIPVACPVLKQVETLPNTGPGETIAAAFTITVIAGYFLMRTRLLSKEVGIIRRSYQQGGRL